MWVLVLDCLDVIFEVIKKYYEIHCEFSRKYYSNVAITYPNLKRLCIEDMLKDKKFMMVTIPEYIDELKQNNKLGLKLEEFHDFDCKCRYRFKLVDTIYEKVQHYVDKDDHEGKLYVAKTLNDFCGIRIILPNVRDNIEVIKSLLESLKNDKVIQR